MIYSYIIVNELSKKYKNVEFKLNPRSATISWKGKKRKDKKIVHGGCVIKNFKQSKKEIENIVASQLARKIIVDGTYRKSKIGRYFKSLSWIGNKIQH
ncbi:MAG: hypothetical protein ACTSXD_08430 [Candidatus Heimdallarchaeaceae archaeon]